MCGIVGLITPSPQLAPTVIDAMRDRLAHRGPDGKGSWLGRSAAQGSVALGHRRLSIIDLSTAADQPMVSGNGSYIVVYNGEIYNYIELRQELRDAGLVFRTDSDTEVLLAAYQRWGVDCLPRLNGMFAFLLWDRERDLLFAARDRFGEKPLYIASLPQGGLAFASEAKALFACPDITAEVDEVALGDFVAGAPLSYGAETLFANVRSLPAAHALLIDGAGQELRRWRYWTPDYTKVRSGIRPDQAVAEISERLQASLRLRLRSDVQVGSCLSGGLDSSTLVGYLHRILDAEGRGPALTYSARFDDDPTVSEGDYIDLMLAHTGADAVPVSPVGEEFTAEARQLYWHQEIPFLSLSTYLEWRVLKRARETGTPVMIDGQGADELLGGYPSFFALRQRDLAEQGRLWRLWRDTTAMNGRLRAASRRYVDSARRFNPDIALGARALSGAAASGLARRMAGAASGGPGYFRRQLAAFMLHDSLPEQLQSADRNGMAFGVETRFPFLDHELVDWCIGLPDDMMIRDGWQKWILRAAGDGVVPDPVRWRPEKVGYRAPQDRWMREGVMNWMAERLFDGRSADLPQYDRQAAELRWKEHLAGDADHSWILFRWAGAVEWHSLAVEGVWSAGLSATEDHASLARVVDPWEAAQ